MWKTIKAGLAANLDTKLVDELLEAYAEAKKNFYVGGLRLSAVEGGRYCEAAFRILQQATGGTFTPLGSHLDTERVIRDLMGLPAGAHPDSMRLHIPRALRVVYDVRNKRDAAHLADGIDPNLQDATLVVSVLDWTLAELVRLYHQVTADRAQEIVEALVQRKVPAVQNFDGFLKVLRPELGASDYVLLILYERGGQGASLQELSEWVQPKMRANLSRTLRRLVDEKAFLHKDQKSQYYVLTALGIAEVEGRDLHK